MGVSGTWLLQTPSAVKAFLFVVMGGWWVLAAPASHLLMRWVTSKPQAHLLCAKAE
ncbi:hypothetical protein O5169_04625 [Escherichia coli]|nr:hypothetical protein [Escherichia coli]